jgi:hypothetical protein
MQYLHWVRRQLFTFTYVTGGNFTVYPSEEPLDVSGFRLVRVVPYVQEMPGSGSFNLRISTAPVNDAHTWRTASSIALNAAGRMLPAVLPYDSTASVWLERRLKWAVEGSNLSQTVQMVLDLHVLAYDR